MVGAGGEAVVVGVLVGEAEALGLVLPTVITLT